jgi:hypothetical protein
VASFSRMTSKRKTDSDSLTVDEKRELVARAIANATSVEGTKSSGATAAIDASERFPLPGLAFSGDSEELHLPLRLGDASTRKIKQWATIVSQPASVVDGQAAAMWEVDGASLELRNPRWATFLDESVTAMREKLTIAPAAEIRLSLRKMALVGVGAQLRLDRDRAEEDKEDEKVDDEDGVVFGSFVVVLPSTFESAESGVFRLPPDPEATKQHSFWANHAPSPPKRPNIYDLQYAAFYNDSECVVEPVVSGEALFLVYDLVTTTPSEIPLVAGPKRLQQVLNDALTVYFDVVPVSLTKRFKLNADASRSVNEFLTDRRFLYPVVGSSFEKLLYGKDRQVADRLATFCRQSQGQYALYLVSMTGLRKKSDRYSNTYSVCLHGPCIRHGETRERMFPRSPVRFYEELSHAGFLDTLEYLKQGLDQDVDGWEIKDTDFYESDDEDDYRRGYKTKRHYTHALVVQPATLEHAQWAKGPFKRIVEKVHELADGSREEGSRLVRRVLSIKRGWDDDEERFEKMLNAVLALDDATVFHDLLRSVTSFESEDENIPRGIQHFGLDSCLAVMEGIIDDPRSTFRSRVNLVCMALLNSSNTDHIDHLMHKLAAVVPWVGTRAPTENKARRFYGEDPYEEDLTRLFELAFRSSPSTLLELVGEPHAVRATIDCLVPSLVALAKELSVADRSRLLPLLRSLRETVEAAMKDSGPFTETVNRYDYKSAVDAIKLLSSLID